MRKDAWRLDPEAYEAGFELAPRYTDLDTWRHVNNVAVHQMHQEGRVRYLMRLLGDDAWYSDSAVLRPRRAVTHFLRVTHYPAPVTCGVTLVGADADNLRLATGLFQAGACVGIQECDITAWDRDGPVPLPEAVKAAAAERGVGALESGPDAPAPVEDAGHYPLTGELSARYGDLDADSRIGEAAVARYMEQSRSTVIRQIGLEGQGLVVASVDLSFRGYRPVGGPVRLPAGVAHVGRSSFVVQSLAIRRDRLIAVGESVMVVTDPATGRPQSMNPGFRERLAGFRLPER